MALTISSTNGISGAAGRTENALRQLAPLNGRTNGPLPLFKLISEDILVNIFSRLEEDPRHLARLACVCRIFAHVVRNVCWKRQCTRIVPEIIPSPHTHLDEIPEPPGGWGALMKLLVCCPGLKHAGVASPCWDLGLEREIGPTELYEIQPRYAPKRRIEAKNEQGPGSGGLSTGATGDSPVLLYTLSTRGSSVQSDTKSRAVPRGDSSVGSYLKCLTGNGQAGVDSAVTIEIGDGNGDGKSFEKDQSAPMDAVVQGTASGERSAGNGDPSVDPKFLTEGGWQDNSAAVLEESLTSLLAKNPPDVVDAFGQGILSGESKAAATAPGNPIVQSSMEQGNASVALTQILQSGNDQVGMSALTAEKNGWSASVNPSSTVKAHGGSGRPPRRKPVKRVQWKEEELVSKDDKVVGSKFGGLEEHVTDRDRGRSMKRKERALRRLLARIPEDPKQRLHIVPAEWTLPREEGSRLLASRFRYDSLYICDWPGCVHASEKRNYKLFRGFFKDFKTTLLWRNLKDMNARKTNIACAFCSSTSTWDMMTAFCLRRSFEYHDDGEPVVHACVCENGHVAGAWTDRPGMFAAT